MCTKYTLPLLAICPLPSPERQPLFESRAELCCGLCSAFVGCCSAATCCVWWLFVACYCSRCATPLFPFRPFCFLYCCSNGWDTGPSRLFVTIASSTTPRFFNSESEHRSDCSPSAFVSRSPSPAILPTPSLHCYLGSKSSKTTSFDETTLQAAADILRGLRRARASMVLSSAFAQRVPSRVLQVALIFASSLRNVATAICSSYLATGKC